MHRLVGGAAEVRPLTGDAADDVCVRRVVGVARGEQCAVGGEGDHPV
jgi:hypothetical protein